MRWLKHMTAASRDEKIARLLNKHGPEGYGTWWLVLEAVAEKLDQKTTLASVSYPARHWAMVVRCSANHIKMRLRWLVDEGLIETLWSDDGCTVTVPNLLKYRDEWSSRSGVTREPLGSKSQSQIQIQNIDSQSTASVGELRSEVAAVAGRKSVNGRTDRTRTEGPKPEPEKTPEGLAGLENIRWYCEQPECRSSDDPPDKIALKIYILAEQLGLTGFEAAAKIERAWRKAHSPKRRDLLPQGAGWLFGVLRSELPSSDAQQSAPS